MPMPPPPNINNTRKFTRGSLDIDSLPQWEKDQRINKMKAQQDIQVLLHL